MKIPRTKKRLTLQEIAFTLIELLVVIGIIALLASIAVPAFTGVQIRAAQTKAMNNAKQIGLVCKQYAIDNNGAYPVVSSTATTANDCFDELMPTYLQTISIFWQVKDSQLVTTQPGDPAFGTAAPPYLGTHNYNHWAYVSGLYDTSNAAAPLIADGFATIASHNYVYTDSSQGGIWKGQQAIVIFCDDSARVMKTTSLGGGSYNVQVSGTDIFLTSGGAYLTATNTVLNPYGYN